MKMIRLIIDEYSDNLSKTIRRQKTAMPLSGAIANGMESSPDFKISSIDAN